MPARDILHCCVCLAGVLVGQNRLRRSCEHAQNAWSPATVQEEGVMGTAKLVAGAGAGALAAAMAAQVAPHLATFLILGFWLRASERDCLHSAASIAASAPALQAS